jgi:GTPase KRas protein
MVEYLDTVSQEEYAALREQWMRGCEGALLVYSITSRESFDKMQNIWNTFKEVKTKQGA